MINRRLLVVIAVIIGFAFLMSSCSYTKNIPVSFYQDYNSEVLKDSNVKNVNLTFTRPVLTIEVQAANSIGEDEIAKIFESTKSFVTVDKMKAIAKYVKWNGSALGEIDLIIVNSTNGGLLKEYTTNYYKSGVVIQQHLEDQPPEDIDGYKTWWDITPDE
ncbi:MAG: hypothetical protein FWF33_05830 [Clostridiales bacterium]|nr:hypothetical protein [Clostridiales bacterium]